MQVEALLGPLPEGWHYKTLGQVCEEGGGGIQTGPFGSQLHASDYVAVGIPSIMPQNIGDNRIVETGIARITETDALRLSRYRVQAGDIIYSRRGDVERRALIREHEEGWLCGTGCLRVRPGPRGPNASYSSFYLGHPAVREWIVRHAHGATMLNLNTTILSNCPFVVPPRSDQNAIAAILTSLDDKIELNRQMNETLEAMARAIFKSWFIDFDPVRAKMEGRDTGLAPEIAALFPERFADDGLPEGWDRVELGEQFDLSPRTPLSEGDELPYVDMAALPTNSARVTAIAKRSPTSGARFTNGDALLARITPCLENGKAAYVDFLENDEVGIGSTEFIVFRPKGILSGVWAYLLMRDDGFRGHAIANMSGTSGRQRVSSEALAPWSISLPPPPVIRAFDSISAAIFKSLKAHDDESNTLAALRNLLLPKLMTGEIRIKNAEKLFGEAGA